MRGCLHKRKTKRGLKPGESSWSIILSLGRDPKTGKQRQKWITFHGTRKQAEQKLNSLVGEVHKGEFVEPSKVTVGDWLEEWLDKAIKPPRKTENTYDSYYRTIKNHLKPTLGHLLLQKLTALHVERYNADCKLKLSSAAVHHVILTSALDAAINAGLLRTNVAKRATNKPRPRRELDLLQNVWTADEARRFLAAVKEHGSTQYKALFALALDGGMRKRELLALQWRDIDGGKLQVERQVMDKTILPRPNGGVAVHVSFTLPKGKRARSLDLSDETLTLLAAHKREQAEIKLKNRLHYKDHGLMFAQAWENRQGRRSAALGSPLNAMGLAKQLNKFRKLAGVKRITVHGLRHTCATLLLAAGVQPHVVQRRLGHARVETTLNLYAHVLPAMQADAAARLAVLLHG